MTQTGRLRFTFFAPPGAVAVTPAALAMAREFALAVAQKTPGVDFVVAFEWADSFSYRPRIDGPRVDLGPCLRLMGYARDVIGNVDGFSFALIIPRHIYEAHTERVIAPMPVRRPDWCCAKSDDDNV